MTPANTWALVVGIEEYPGLPDDWRLPGPALDAIKFVNWLLARKVPPEQIRLRLSAADIPALLQKLEKPVQWRGATEQDIRDVLVKDVCSWNGDLLFVYWGGHGTVDSIDRDEPRRLQFADASPNNPASLSLPGLVATLQSERTGRIPNQALLIDACATFQARSRFRANVAPWSPPLGLKQDAGVRQFQFLASRRGEAAINDTANRTGAFSRRLLAELEKPSATWPPDLPAAARAVQEDFAALEKAGRGMQTPIVVGQDWSGDSIDVASATSVRRRSLARLRAHLERLEVLTSRLLALFRATFTISPKVADVQGLGDIMDFLLASPPLKAKGCEWPPEAEFAERVLQHPDTAASGDLSAVRAWVAEAATARQLQDLRAALQIEDRVTPRFLVIELHQDDANATLRVSRAWLYRQGDTTHEHHWKEEELASEASDPERLDRIVRDTVARGLKHVAVELLTPKQHLGMSPYAWKTRDSLAVEQDLAAIYGVVVRWRDRLAEPGAFRQGLWEQVARRRLEKMSRDGIATLEWLPTTVAKPQDLWKRMEDGDCADLFMVGHVPMTFTPNHPVVCALVGGAPAICWWLTSPPDETRAKDVLESLLKGKQPDTLASELHAGRRSKDADEQAACSVTILFWDHLDRNPYQRLEPPQ